MKNQTTTKLFSLSCTNQIDLLPQLVSVVKDLGLLIETLSQSKTDVPEIIILSIEIAIPGNLVDATILNFKKIPGVIDVFVSFGSVLNMALFSVCSKMDKNIWDTIHKYHAQCISLENDSLTFLQIAKENEIISLFNVLDGPELLSFSQIPISNYKLSI